MRWLALLLLSTPLLAISNAVVVYEASGASQTNRPLSLMMVFIQGEFPTGTFPKPRVDGVVPISWQVDVKSRWPDGSIMTAFVSLPISLSANGQAVVDFVRDSNACHLGDQSTCEAAAMDQSEMLNAFFGAWDATIQGTANSITYSASARTMLGAGAWRYWLRGPVVTRVIVEDMSTSLAYDFGWQWDGSNWQAPSSSDYKSLHPIFDLAFWPSHMEVGWFLENAWRTKAQLQQFDLVFSSDQGVQYSKADYRMAYKGGASYYAWRATAPGDIFVDRNFRYLVATKVLPPYDTSIEINSGTYAWLLDNWPSNVGTDDQGRPDPRSCTSQNPCAYIKTDMPGTGDHMSFGTIIGAQSAFLSAMSSPSFTLAQKMQGFERIVLGSADAAMTIRFHTRESWVMSGDSAYLNWPEDTVTPSFGRIFSVVANRYGRTHYYEYSGPYPYVSRCTGCPSDNHPWIEDVAHTPSPLPLPYILTGRYAYLQTLLEWAGVAIGHDHPDYDRQREFGIMIGSGLNERIGARSFKNAAWGYLLAPDGPERLYLKRILKNEDRFFEGLYDVGEAPASCVGEARSSFSFTINTTNGMWRPNGSVRRFYVSSVNGNWGLSSVTGLTVDGVSTPIGVCGQTSNDWCFVPGGKSIIYTGSTPPTSSIAGNASVNWYPDPWCFGMSYSIPSNPLAQHVPGHWGSDCNGSCGAPWMVSYHLRHLGWFRDSGAIAGWGEQFGKRLVKRFVDGMSAEGTPLLYDIQYRKSRGRDGLFQTWADVRADSHPTVTLATGVSDTATTFTMSCSLGYPSCFYAPNLPTYAKVDNEWVKVTAASGANLTVVRGQWGTVAASHSAGAAITLAIMLEGAVGHDYSNLLHNAVAAFPEAESAWVKMRALFSKENWASRNTDLRYTLVPRSLLGPSNVRAWAAGGQVRVYYNAPSNAPCKVALDPVTGTDGTSDGGGPRARSWSVPAATGQHLVQVACGDGRVMASVIVP